jgi:putative membrane protein
MMNLLIRLLLSAVGILIAAMLLKSGVHVENYGTAFIAAAVLALLNATIRPLLIILTIPVTIFTLGLFLLVINALMVMLASSIIDGFYVDNFWYALFFGLIVSVINSIFTAQGRRQEYR